MGHIVKHTQYSIGSEPEMVCGAAMRVAIQYIVGTPGCDRVQRARQISSD